MLARYGTDIIPFSYTGSENIDITDNQISLNLPIKINNEIVLNPRAYDGAVVWHLQNAARNNRKYDGIKQMRYG